MTGRRIIYLCTLAGCLVFYFCYQQWLSWVVLLAVILIPWLSLVLSLPAMLQFRAEVDGPGFVAMGDPAYAALWGLSNLPQPLFRGRLTRTDLVTGQTVRHDPRTPLPTDHCGGVRIDAKKVGICDYLGLFCLPAGQLRGKTVIVRPTPLAMEAPADLSRYVARSWQPKPGGGFAENHELRLYRPGDGLNQVHWKLTAKTGKLIIREPMEPNRGLVLVTMDLSGTRTEIDRKFGYLLTLSRDLLDRQLHHELRVLTADGVVSHPIQTESDLTAAVDRLLCCPAAKEGSLQNLEAGASWQFHIGGEPHEA